MSSEERKSIRLLDVLEFLVSKNVGQTEVGLAVAVFGKNGIQQRVNQDCALLVQSGRIERRGSGGVADPFTYWPAPR